MYLAAHPMVPEQRTKPGRTHRLATLLAFQANEKGGCIGERTFQVHITPENLQDFRGQRDMALFVPFAMDAHLAVGELQVFELQSQDLAGAQAIEEHQSDQCEITEGAEALPEFGNVLGRKRHDDPPLLFEPETPGDGVARPAVTERGSLSIAALEMHCADRDLPPSVEAITAPHRTQAMIHRLRCGLGILLELRTDIVDQRGFGDLGERLVVWFEPASEVQQVVSIDTKRSGGKLA